MGTEAAKRAGGTAISVALLGSLLGATAAGLTGTYLAYLSSSTGTGESRYTTNGLPWRRVDGALLAPTAADFLDLSRQFLDNFLSKTATGAATDLIFTWDGSTTINCNDWTSSSSADVGTIGIPLLSAHDSFRSQGQFNCAANIRLVCMEN